MPLAQQIQVLRAHTDIVQVVGERVALRKSGHGFIGLCPFHGERIINTIPAKEER